MSSTAISTTLQEVPELLKGMKNWVTWKLEATKDGGVTKLPKIPGTNRNASSTDPSTWTDFQTAMQNTTISATSGVGFVIGGEAVKKRIVGFDLDNCRNPETGTLTAWAEEIVDHLDSYTEVTPSGTGVRVLVIGDWGKESGFNLNPEAGVGGEKVTKIEVFDHARYFTVTGDSFFEPAGEIRERDLTDAYKLCREIKARFPMSRTPAASSSAAPTTSTQIARTGTVFIDKLSLLMTGTVTGDKPLVVADGNGNSLTYASHSDADMALCTVLAMTYGSDPAKIEEEFGKSHLVRDKWTNREGYRETTIRKAIASAEKFKVEAEPNTPAITPEVQALLEMPDENSESAIPPFDPSVVNGIYAKFVELITRGTTLEPQFAYVIAKTIVGMKMAGKVKFETTDIEPRLYVALIGATGSGKGEAYRRVRKIIQPDGALFNAKIKILNSADSGAGLKEFFFSAPENEPVLCFVDEIEDLGNKAQSTRNPGILDTMITLADDTSITRSLAKGTRTKNDARLSMVMCGQDGLTYTKALAGRTKLGLWDRFYPEYGAPQETGDMPPIDPVEAMNLLVELNAMDYSGTMTMTPQARYIVDTFWKTQPVEVRKKARWKKTLQLDAYMSAFGRGVRAVEPADVQIAIKIFARQLVIRQVCFTTEVPDRVGYYLGLIKSITEKMVNQLSRGVPRELVAKSRRDYEKQTHAHRDNETHIFARAWQVHEPVWLERFNVKASNGQYYSKFLPVIEN